MTLSIRKLTKEEVKLKTRKAFENKVILMAKYYSLEEMLKIAAVTFPKVTSRSSAAAVTYPKTK